MHSLDCTQFWLCTVLIKGWNGSSNKWFKDPFLVSCWWIVPKDCHKNILLEFLYLDWFMLPPIGSMCRQSSAHYFPWKRRIWGQMLLKRECLMRSKPQGAITTSNSRTCSRKGQCWPLEMGIKALILQSLYRLGTLERANSKVKNGGREISSLN